LEKTFLIKSKGGGTGGGIIEKPNNLFTGGTPTITTNNITYNTGGYSRFFICCDTSGQNIALGGNYDGCWTLNLNSLCPFTYSTNFGTTFAIITGSVNTGNGSQLPAAGNLFTTDYPSAFAHAIVTDGQNWIASNWINKYNGQPAPSGANPYYGLGTFYNSNIKGTTWTQSTNLQNYSFFCLALSKSPNPSTGTGMALGLANVNPYAQTLLTGNSLYYSTNYGSVWTQIPGISIQIQYLECFQLSISQYGNAAIVVNNYGNGGYVLAYNNSAWTSASFSLANCVSCAISGNGKYVIIGTNSSVAYVATFNPTTCTLGTLVQSNTFPTTVVSVAASYSGKYMIAGSNNTLYVSSNYGATFASSGYAHGAYCTMTPDAANVYTEAYGNDRFYRYS